MDNNTSKLFDYIKSNHAKFIARFVDSDNRVKLSKHACCQPKDKLNAAVSISQFKPNEFQYNSCLLVKIVGNLTKSNNELITIIQEPITKTISILLLLHSSHYINQLKKDGIIIVKEPLLKHAKIFNKSIQVLIVDNIYFNITLTDHEDEKKYDTANSNTLKEKGNKYFASKKYIFAINCYSKALNELQESQKDSNDILDLKFKLLCNRSLCFIHINDYPHALTDAERALKLNKNSFKAKFRCITALNAVGKYLKAMKLLKSINKNKIESNSIKKKFNILEKEIVRKYRESMGILQNNKNEKIDFALYPAFAHDTNWETVSDYIGPLAAKYINKQKGRGIVATKDIKCGDIVLIEKVFAKGMFQNSKQQKRFTKQELLLMDIIKKIYPNLEREGFEYDSCLLNAKRLSYLCDSAMCDNNLLKDKIPKMDLFKYNELLQNENIILSIRDIEGIIDCNAYESLIDPNDIDLIEAKYANNNNSNLIENKMYIGLWLVTSFINHNDIPNVYRIIWYNTMIIIADTDIKKGEEICWCYLNPFMSQNEKKNQLYEGWGIE